MEPFFPNEAAQAAAAYHIQQAVEKLLQARILIAGEAPVFTHNITKLAARCGRLGIALPAQVEEISDSLTLWESASRYDPGFLFSQGKYEKAKTVYEVLREELDLAIRTIGQTERK